MPEAHVQSKGWQKEKQGWKELDGRLILSSFNPLSACSISGLWEMVCKFHRLPHAEVTFRNEGERTENEWEGEIGREWGRSALWCAASTEEQAVLCPSPTHEGKRNESMNEGWVERRMYGEGGWRFLSLTLWMTLCVSHLRGPVLLYKSWERNLVPQVQLC